MANSKRRCSNCKDYFPVESMIKFGLGMICSEDCLGQKVKDSNTPTPPKTPQSQKKIVRQQVIERDGPNCISCGQKGPGLHLHRVIYGSQGGAYEKSNCVQLCNGCHEGDGPKRGVHSSKKDFLPILLAHLAGDVRARGKLRKEMFKSPS